MNELVVFDVSPMVYVGGSHKDEFWGYPVGGIKYFLNRLAVALAGRDFVVPCFDSPSFRSDLYPEYKKGREKRPEIYSQIETLYEGLQQCGIRCEKYDGYEADDVVEWAVAQNVDKFIRGVTIYCNDNDLCHSIRNGVVLHTVNESMNDITPSNFEYGIYNGKRIPYNTISAYKVFCGCKSDGIPVLNLECGLGGYALFQKWCEIVSSAYPLSNRAIGANPAMVRVFANSSGIFTEEEKAEVEKRIKLIYPADVPEGVRIEPTSWNDVNKDALAKFMSLYGAGDALRCLSLRRCELTENDKTLLSSKAKALRTGAYAADKNLEFNTKGVRSNVIDLDAFTRGF